MTDDKKHIMGVRTSVVRVREWKRNTLVEETRDWYAQDKTGTVWYFGEAVDNYKDGKLDNHKGSWEAGVDGAVPGIIMLGEPEVGQTYRQEYYKHRAEDMGTIVALDAKVSVPLGKFENCLKVRDWSRIEAGNEHKYYCPEIGFLTMEDPSKAETRSSWWRSSGASEPDRAGHEITVALDCKEARERTHRKQVEQQVDRSEDVPCSQAPKLVIVGALAPLSHPSCWACRAASRWRKTKRRWKRRRPVQPRKVRPVHRHRQQVFPGQARHAARLQGIHPGGQRAHCPSRRLDGHGPGQGHQRGSRGRGLGERLQRGQADRNRAGFLRPGQRRQRVAPRADPRNL